EFQNDFIVDVSLLMCQFCCHSVNWKTKATLTTHINTNPHQNVKQKAYSFLSKTRQPTLNSVLEASESNKTTINDLICTFVQ
ncbi:17712_t:CDS:1, partial [Cetraspora pellucida]